MSSHPHTPEPWVIRGSVTAGLRIESDIDDGERCAIREIAMLPSRDHVDMSADARRIVSCVNALSGLNPEAVADVVKALRKAELALFTVLAPCSPEEITDSFQEQADAHDAAYAALTRLRDVQPRGGEVMESQPPETCEVCGNPWRVGWTDSHGVAQCFSCGACYRLFHYDDDKKRVDKPPECTLNEDGRAAIKAFYDETKRPISAQALGLSFPGGQTVATGADIEAWNQYRDAQEEGEW